MTYTIDISIDVRKNKDLSAQKTIVEKFCNLCNCEKFYGTHEFGGHGRTINRNHFVMTFFYEEQQDLIRFILFVKKDTPFKIEMVGYDNCLFKIIFASKKYLSFMEKEMVDKYNNSKKELRNGPFGHIVRAIIH